MIHGQVAGAIAGDVVTLLAKPFGAKLFAPVGTATLSSGSQPYSFKVRPTAATAYEARVTTGTNVYATSTTQTVYVLLPDRYVNLKPKCSRTRCTATTKAYSRVPTSAYRSESEKHAYLYAAIGYPRVPKAYTLTTSGKVSRPRKISANTFEVTVTWYIVLSRHHSTYWILTFCRKDTESRDGMNLPGHHGCGNRKVSRKQADIYLG